MGDFIGGVLCFLALLAIVAFFTEPVFRTIVIVVVLLIIVLTIVFPKRSGRGGGPSAGYPASRTNVSDYSGGSGNCTSTSEIGCVYRGSYAGGFVLASYRDGKVFDGYNSGLNLSFYKARYDINGRVFGNDGSQLGHYEAHSGYIYRGWSDSYSAILGRCERGYIYDSASGSNIVGTYVGDPEGAAAAALVFILS